MHLYYQAKTNQCIETAGVFAARPACHVRDHLCGVDERRKKSQHVEANLARLKALGELIEIRPFDKQAAVCYGDIRSGLEKRGEMIGGNDLLIAAHALSLGWTLVTNNEREFGRVKGLKVENWSKE